LASENTTTQSKKMLINFIDSSNSEQLREEIFLLAVINNIYTYRTNTETTFKFVASKEELETFSNLLKNKLSEEDFSSLNVTAIF